jgi:hypothetical protein
MRILAKMAMITVMCAAGCAAEQEPQAAEVTLEEGGPRPEGILPTLSYYPAITSELTYQTAVASGLGAPPVPSPALRLDASLSCSGSTPILVAVLFGSSSFNAGNVVLSSVRVDSSVPKQVSLVREDLDSYLDVNAQFNASGLPLTVGSSITMTGLLSSGQAFSATTSVTDGGIAKCTL